MAHIEPHLVPDEYYSAKDIDRLFLALEKRFEAREVMRIEQAADFLSCSVSKIHEMCKNGKLPYHRVEGLGGKLLLRSELIAFIKKQ